MDTGKQKGNSNRQFRRKVRHESIKVLKKLKKKKQRIEESEAAAFNLELQELPFECNSEVDTNVNNTDVKSKPTCSSLVIGPDCQSISSESSCLEDEDEEFSIYDLQEGLKRWQVKHNISITATTELLQILKNDKKFKELPSDARTLLKTPQITTIRNITPGLYCHFGLRNQMIAKLKTCSNHLVNLLSLQINIDGLPIAKSNSVSFWPILAFICEFNFPPFIVGLWSGDKKPANVNEYLKEFTEELKSVLESGIEHENKIITVKLKSFVCDAPARAFITCIKGHTGYYGCGKCTIKGKYYENRVIFEDLNCPTRSDQSFRNRQNEEHHNGDSILENLPIDLVKSFPYESMYRICLGVVKKLLLLWMRGKIAKFRLKSDDVDKLSNNLINLKKYICKDFNRKPRTLREIDRFKATEFRQFLLYTGPIATKGILPKDHYDLFLCLHVAITILSSPKYFIIYNEYANSMLHAFVKNFSNLYGKENLSYNVHGLLHISEDAKHLGPLDTFSAFKFENLLGGIKRLIRKPQNPIQQVYRRISEQNQMVTKCDDSELFQFSTQYENGILIEDCTDPQYKNLKFKKCKLNLSKFDNFCELNDGSVIKIKNFCYCTSRKSMVIIGNKYKTQECLFSYPCDSLQIGIKKVNLLEQSAQIWPIDCIENKLQVFRLATGELAVFPLIHNG